MINRFFFISKDIFSTGIKPEEADNIYYSILSDPSQEGSLEMAYTGMTNSDRTNVCLTLSISKPLTPENVRSVASFLFSTTYLRLAYRPVVNITGNSLQLMDDAIQSLSACFLLQGIADPIFYKLVSSWEPSTDNYKLFDNHGDLINHHKMLLREGLYRSNLFFLLDSPETLQGTLLSLQQAEEEIKKREPKLLALIMEKEQLQQQVFSLQRKVTLTQQELEFQKQHMDVLRSEHSTGKLQDFYNNEYEILPRWYKRFGHIIKVIQGKRSFRSLFSDNVEKYKK